MLSVVGPLSGFEWDEVGTVSLTSQFKHLLGPLWLRQDESVPIVLTSEVGRVRLPHDANVSGSLNGFLLTAIMSTSPAKDLQCLVMTTTDVLLILESYTRFAVRRSLREHVNRSKRVTIRAVESLCVISTGVRISHVGSVPRV